MAQEAFIFSEADLEEQRRQGLTSKGEQRLKSSDTRCRPRDAVRKLCGDKPLPQFRLKDPLAAAHAEDLVMLWVQLTGKGELAQQLPLHRLQLAAISRQIVDPAAPVFVQTLYCPRNSEKSSEK